jgi:PAS domain S-box-containing protein
LFFYANKGRNLAEIQSMWADYWYSREYQPQIHYNAGTYGPMTYNLYLFALLMAATCCSLFIAHLAWRRREFPISRSLFYGMCAGAFYSLGYAFEIVSTSLEQIRFWLRMEYIGISFGPLIWFTMVLHYTGCQELLRKRIIPLLMLVPFLTFVSHYTNEWHHLFYRSMAVDRSEGFPLVSLEVGPFYMLHVAYSYSLIIIGMWLLTRMYRASALHMKKQIALMMIGSCGPYGITIVYLSGILSSPIDLSPFGFLFSGVFYMWAIYQFNMLKLAPLALQKVFESMKDAVIVFDLDNSITSFNQKAGQIFTSLQDKRAIGRSAAHIFSPYEGLLETILKGSPTESRMKIGSHGNLKYYHVHVSYVCDESQNTVGRMLLLSDVTEAVLAEERLLANARQLRELNLFKDKMFTVVAHDIRDPLSLLIGLMEALKDELETCEEKHGEIVHEMEQQIQNTFALVESLLDWFRSQRGGMMFNPMVWDLSQAVASNMQLLKIRSEGKRIQVISDIPVGTLVYADKEMLDLIIRNLLSNAIKFTDEGGEIYIKAELAIGNIIVSVNDTGKGIQPDQAKRLLQTDHPVSLAGTAGERGFGLGLTLCKEFVRINGGEIWFESTPEQGSSFYFTISAHDGGAA